MGLFTKKRNNGSGNSLSNDYNPVYKTNNTKFIVPIVVLCLLAAGLAAGNYYQFSNNQTEIDTLVSQKASIQESFEASIQDLQEKNSMLQEEIKLNESSIAETQVISDEYEELSKKYEELNKKYEDMSAEHDSYNGQYDELAAEYEALLRHKKINPDFYPASDVIVMKRDSTEYLHIFTQEAFAWEVSSNYGITVESNGKSGEGLENHGSVRIKASSTGTYTITFKNSERKFNVYVIVISK